MSENAKRRADEVGAREDVQRWIKRLRKLSREMPRDVWVFVASGTPTVLARDEHGHHIDVPGRDGGVDPSAIIDTIEGDGWDGGDW